MCKGCSKPRRPRASTRGSGSNPPPPAAPAPLPGMAGYEVMEYLGGSAGRQTYRVELAVYQFGGSRHRYGYVDKTHVADFLSMKDKGGAALFRVVQPPKPPKAKRVPPPEPIPVKEDPPEIPEVQIPEEPEPLDIEPDPTPDPGDYSVRELKQLTIRPEQAREMLDRELEGKQRGTAIAYIESHIMDWD